MDFVPDSHIPLMFGCELMQISENFSITEKVTEKDRALQIRQQCKTG